MFHFPLISFEASYQNEYKRIVKKRLWCSKRSIYVVFNLNLLVFRFLFGNAFFVYSCLNDLPELLIAEATDSFVVCLKEELANTNFSHIRKTIDNLASCVELIHIGMIHFKNTLYIKNIFFDYSV